MACIDFRGMEPVHDMWQHGAHQSHDVLWIGRSVYSKKLIALASEEGIVYHSTWTTGELRSLLQEQRQASKTTSPVQGLSSMNLAELREKCAELGLSPPEKAARIIRDQTTPPDQEIVTFRTLQELQSAPRLLGVEHPANREQLQCVPRTEADGGLREGEVREGDRTQGHGAGSGPEESGRRATTSADAGGPPARSDELLTRLAVLQDRYHLTDEGQ